MRLLYATSISYPSTLANRLQTLAMAREFHGLLGGDFFFGVQSFPDKREELLQILEMNGNRRSVALASRYARFIRQKQITHVYCREEKLFFFLRLYASVLAPSAKFFFEAHTVQTDLFFKSAVRRADGVVAITRGVAAGLYALGVSKEHVIVEADGVDLSRFEGLPGRAETRSKFGLPQDSKVLLYVGSFGFVPPWDYYAWKGADIFLDAAEHAPQGWVFACAGGDEKEVEAIRERYKDSRILLLGYVPPAEVPALMRAADALVIPNKRGEAGSDLYTSPLKLFEYMASGVPIIASDLPSLREVVSEREVTFFEPNDAAALVDAARHVFENEKSAGQRAEQARQLVERYAWSARAERILRFLARES